MDGALQIMSTNECDGHAPFNARSFDVKLEGGECLNKLVVKDGEFESGELVYEKGRGPAIMIGMGSLAMLVDGLPLIRDFVADGFLNIPGFHDKGMYKFDVQIPLTGTEMMSGGMTGGGIVVSNMDTKDVVAYGSVDNTCGAQLPGPSVIPVPTLPQYALILLIMGLLFAAVRVTRRGMSA